MSAVHERLITHAKARRVLSGPGLVHDHMAHGARAAKVRMFIEFCLEVVAGTHAELAASCGRIKFTRSAIRPGAVSCNRRERS